MEYTLDPIDSGAQEVPQFVLDPIDEPAPPVGPVQSPAVIGQFQGPAWGGTTGDVEQTMEHIRAIDDPVNSANAELAFQNQLKIAAQPMAPIPNTPMPDLEGMNVVGGPTATLGEFGDAAKGIGEAALTFGTGMVGSSAAGLAGLTELAKGNGLDAAGDKVQSVTKSHTYVPRSDSGKKVLDLVMAPFEALSAGAKAWGNQVYEKAANYPDEFIGEYNVGKFFRDNADTFGAMSATGVEFAPIALLDYARSISVTKLPDFKVNEILAKHNSQKLLSAPEVAVAEAPPKAPPTAKTEVKVPIVPKEPIAPVGAGGTKQMVLDSLRAEMRTITGPKIAQFNKAVQAIENYDGEITLGNIDEILPFKKPGSISKRIKDMLPKATLDPMVDDVPEFPVPKVETEGLPEKLSKAIDKPEQVQTLKQMGITDEVTQVEAIIKDGIGTKLDNANALEAKHPDVAKKLRNEGIANANKLKRADGELTESLVDRTLREKIKPEGLGDAETITLYHGTNLDLKSSKDLPDGHRGYFGTVDKNVASKFGSKIHEVEVKTTDLFDHTNPSKVKELVDFIDSKYPNINRIAMEKNISNGNFGSFEDPRVTRTLEDMGYKGNLQIEDGAKVVRMFNKSDFNLKPLPEVTPPVEVKTPEPMVEAAPEVTYQEFDTIALAKGEGYTFEEGSPRYSTLAKAEAALKKGEEVVKVGKRYKTARYTEDSVPKVPSVESVEGFKVMNEVDRATAERDVTEFADDPEFKTVRVGDKYYRMERDVPVERLPDARTKEVKRENDPVELTKYERELLEEEMLNAELRGMEGGIKDLIRESEQPDVTPEAKQIALSEVAKQMKERNKRYVEKINAASSVKVTKPADLAVINSDLATFKSKADIDAYAKAKGDYREVMENHETGEWTFKPEFNELEDYAWEGGLEDSRETSIRNHWEDDQVDFDLSDTGVEDLVSIMNDGGISLYSGLDPALVKKFVSMLGKAGTKFFTGLRGKKNLNEMKSMASTISWQTTALRNHVEKTKNLIVTAKKMGVSVEDLLTMLDQTPEVIAQNVAAADRIQEDIELLRQLDTFVENTFHPTDEVIYQEVTPIKNGVIKNIPITQSLHDGLMNVTVPKNAERFLNIPFTEVLPALHQFTMPRTFKVDEFGVFIRKEFFRPWEEQLHKSNLELSNFLDEIEVIEGTLTELEKDNLSIAWAADQKGGPEALAADGITEIPIMNPAMIKARQAITKWLDKLLDDINYVRVNTGLEPIGKLDNYYPFIRAVNDLRKHGIIDVLTYTKNERIENIIRKYKGSYFPYAKPRGEAKIRIDLDVFTAVKNYGKHAMKDIYIGPVAAKAKMAAEYVVENERGEILTMQKYNPELYKFLHEWSNEIMGIDPIWSAISQRWPKISRTATGISRNIVGATLMFRVTSALIQPTAIVPAMAIAGGRNTAWGVMEMMARRGVSIFDKQITKAYRKSTTINIRNAEFLIGEYLDATKAGRIKQAGGFLLQVLDALTAEAAWYAYFRQIRMMNPAVTEKFAIEYADEMVGKTQGVGIRGAVSPAQANSLTKLGTIFQTFVMANYHTVASEILGVGNPKVSKSVAGQRIIRWLVGMAVANEVYKKLRMRAPFPDVAGSIIQSKDEGRTKLYTTFAAMREALEVLPILGGSLKFESSLGGAGAELANDIPIALGSIIKMTDWDNFTDADKLQSILFVSKVLGTAFGIPGTAQVIGSARSYLRDEAWYDNILAAYREEAKKKRRHRHSPEPPSRPRRPKRGEI